MGMRGGGGSAEKGGWGGGLKKAGHTTHTFRETFCFTETEAEGSSQEQPSLQQHESLLCSKLVGSW